MAITFYEINNAGDDRGVPDVMFVMTYTCYQVYCTTFETKNLHLYKLIVQINGLFDEKSNFLLDKECLTV